MSELHILRMNILGGMNEYVRELGNEDLWESWTKAFPHKCNEDELAEIAEDDNIWLDYINIFARICRIAGIF